MVWLYVLTCWVLQQTIAQDGYIIEKNEFQQHNYPTSSLIRVSGDDRQFKTIVSRNDIPLDYCSEIWNQSFILCMAAHIERVPGTMTGRESMKKNAVIYDIRSNVWSEITTIDLEAFFISPEALFDRALLITRSPILAPTWHQTLEMFSCNINGLICALFGLPHQALTSCCAYFGIHGNPFVAADFRIFFTNKSDFPICLHFSLHNQQHNILISMDRMQPIEKVPGCPDIRVASKHLGTWLDPYKKRYKEEKQLQLQSLNESIIEFCTRYQDERLQNILLFSMIALFVASTSFFSYTFFSK